MDFFNGRLKQAKRRTCKWKDIKNQMRSEKRWVNTEDRVMEPHEDRRSRMGSRIFKEIMVGKFTNPTKDIKLEVSESLQIPSRVNERKNYT